MSYMAQTYSTFFCENESSNFTHTKRGKITDLHTASFTFSMGHNSCTQTLKSTEVKYTEGTDIANTAILSLSSRKYKDDFSSTHHFIMT